MKLKSLHIEDYKVFKDFDIDFVDKEGKPLPIVVLAGVNGSGKTTVLEYIYNFTTLKTLLDDDFIKVLYNNYRMSSLSGDSILDGEYMITHEKVMSFTFYAKPIYFPVAKSNMKDVKESILSFYRKLARKTSHLEALEYFKKYINDIFKELKIDLTIDDINDIDRENEMVIFKNSSGETFEIEELSTGEKTLFSKALYLYLRAYNNQVVLIDEPELSLHPSWQNKVLKIYENFAKLNKCQIIIATHSPHIIGSAKNEYLRILRKDDEGKVEVIKDILSYGRDIEWVLEEVMGTQYTREKNILNKIEACQNLIDDEKFDEAEEEINILEAVIGENDSEILTLRNDLAFERIDFEEDN